MSPYAPGTNYFRLKHQGGMQGAAAETRAVAAPVSGEQTPSETCRGAEPCHCVSAPLRRAVPAHPTAACTQGCRQPRLQPAVASPRPRDFCLIPSGRLAWKLAGCKRFCHCSKAWDFWPCFFLQGSETC